MSEVVVWHGIPGCGKSTAMRERAHAVARETHFPVIVIDPALVDTWADVEHVHKIDDVFRLAYDDGKHVAISPTAGQLELIAAAAKAGKNAILCIDELRPYASSSAVGEELVILARQFRHSNVTLLMGTQYIADVRSDLLSAVTVVYTGRVKSPRILEFLRKEWGLDPAQVKALGRGEWIKTEMGF